MKNLKIFLCSFLCYCSNNLEKLFPLPQAKEPEKNFIEQEANNIRRQISSCLRLSDTYVIFDILQHFREVCGRTAQGEACYFSLMLALLNKQKEIEQEKGNLQIHMPKIYQ